jgi:hypothetical protein
METAAAAHRFPRQASALDLDWRFLLRLKEAGNEAAEGWLADHSVQTRAAEIGVTGN